MLLLARTACRACPALQTRGFRTPRMDGNFWQSVAGVSAASYTLVKLKGLQFAVPLLKFTKLGPALSMVVSMGAYTAIYGWQFAGGMIALLFVHELGHAMAMRRFNVPVGPITFLPFLGAVVEMRRQPVSAYEEAMIALAGPLVGTLATFPFLFASVATGSQFAAGLAHWGCMVNLLNLLPVGSLDGGRIAGALSRHFLAVGLVGCGGLIALYPSNPLLYLVFLSGAYTTYNRYFGQQDSSSFRYFDLSARQRGAIAGAYGGLLVFIAATMELNDRIRKSPQQLRHDLGLPPASGDWGQDLWDQADS